MQSHCCDSSLTTCRGNETKTRWPSDLKPVTHDPSLSTVILANDNVGTPDTQPDRQCRPTMTGRVSRP